MHTMVGSFQRDPMKSLLVTMKLKSKLQWKLYNDRNMAYLSRIAVGTEWKRTNSPCIVHSTKVLEKFPNNNIEAIDAGHGLKLLDVSSAKFQSCFGTIFPCCPTSSPFLNEYIFHYILLAHSFLFCFYKGSYLEDHLRSPVTLNL